MVDFTNLKDLYQNILPALSIKRKELIKDGINYIYEEDIWNYFRTKIWPYKKNLTLYDIIDDILNVDKEKIKIYVLNILTINKREAIF